MTSHRSPRVRVPGLAELAAEQHGICSRRQLQDLGIRADAVRRQVDGERWRPVGPLTVALFTGPLTDAAWRWAAALTVAPEGALCSWTALDQWGLRGWDRPGIHVVVDRGARPTRLPGMVVHESRRHWREDVTTRSGFPLHRVERAVVDAAAWTRSPRVVGGLLAAVVQQRLTTPERVAELLATVGQVRHRRLMQLVLDDVAGGSRAMSEIDLVRLCRAFGLPLPRRQSRRRDGAGRWRYLDAEWLVGRTRVLLEVDGVGHLAVDRWYDDLLRTAEISAPGETVIRLPALAVRVEPKRVAAVLARFLRPAPAHPPRVVRTTTREPPSSF